MKKIFPIFALALLLLTTPAIASKEKSSEKKEIKTNQQVKECDQEDNWKNHGAYVSCVARLGLGGQVTSSAAKSDIGKEDQDDENENEDEDKDEEENKPSPSPSASSSATPTPSVSPSPSGSPSASPSPTQSSSPSATSSASPAAGITGAVGIELGALIEVLSNILKSLHKLI